MPVYLKRSINSPHYRQAAETIDISTIDISAIGAHPMLPFPIEIGAELIVYADGERFIGQAVVRHCHEMMIDWSVGVMFIEQRGPWLANSW